MGGKLRGDFIRLFFYLIDLVVLNLFVDNGTFYVLLILAKYPSCKVSLALCKQK